MRDPFAGKHRKAPKHRRPSRARRLAGVAVFTGATAALATAAMLATAQPAPAVIMGPGQLAQFAQSHVTLTAHVTGSPAQDAAACDAVLHYHHIEAVFNRLVQSGGSMTDADVRRGNHAWTHAWHAADYADHEMAWYMHRYLATGDGWSWIFGANAVCTPDA